MKLYLVCEDDPQETVMRKLSLEIFQIEFDLIVLGKQGKGFIKNRINQYNNANDDILFFVLTDLDQAECAPDLLKKWFNRTCRKNLLFRVAVKEVEAWLLADSAGFSKFIKIDKESIEKETYNIETINNPKEKLISIVSRCKNREIKNDIIPTSRMKNMQGPGYNTQIRKYINEYWSIDRARGKSDSLNRTIIALQNMKKRVINFYN